MVNFENMGMFFANHRKMNDYSQQEVAELILVCIKTVHNLEKGRKSTDFDILMKLCDLYDIPLTELKQFYTRDNDMDYALKLYRDSDKGREKKRKLIEV